MTTEVQVSCNALFPSLTPPKNPDTLINDYSPAFFSAYIGLC